MPEALTPTNTVLSSHGTGATFSYAGLSSRITKVEASGSVTPKETSHLGQAAGSRPIFKKSPLIDGPEIKVEFFGNLMPARGQKLVMTLPANISPTKADVATKAICTQASLKASRGTFIKGSATFRLSGA